MSSFILYFPTRPYAGLHNVLAHSSSCHMLEGYALCATSTYNADGEHRVFHVIQVIT
jgi:hypothetical protein